MFLIFIQFEKTLQLTKIQSKDWGKSIRCSIFRVANQLKYLIEAYKLFPGKDSFFLANKFFNKLVGNDILMSQIKRGTSEKLIRKSWEKDLTKFKATRKKYLLYKDFE